MRIRSLLVSAALLLSLSTAPTTAQTQARVTSIKTHQYDFYSTATLHVLCNGTPFQGLQNSQIRLVDNGRAATSFFILNSPSALARKPFKAMLVLDLSGSMMGAGIAGLKAAAKTLVGFMDPSTDSMGIITFNSIVTLRQTFTSDTALLNAAIDAFDPNNATAVYDAAYRGVETMIATQDTAAQAVIVMTDGADNSSTKLPSDAISLANTQNKRIFTIGLGSMLAGTAQQLQFLAQLTGGQYYDSPGPAELSTIFLQIASFARRNFDEYTIQYFSPDNAAARHELIVTVDLCDTTVTASATRPSGPPVTGLEEAVALSPTRFTILSVTPNPVPGTYVTCTYLMRHSHEEGGIRIGIYDQIGRLRAEHRLASAGAGTHAATIGIADLPNGVYQLVATAGNETQTTRLSIIR